MRVFWALDSKLRERRHFPAINWLTSYSLYAGQLDGWYKANVAEDFPELRNWATELLQREAELQEMCSWSVPTRCPRNRSSFWK